MFINAFSCLGSVSLYRLVWICGKFGGHKTSFSFAIAEEYLKQGYRLITNCKSVWADDIKDIELNENNQLKAVIILDEGGHYFQSSRQIEQIASYANKMDCIYLFPSFFPPARSAQIFQIQPIFSFKMTGIPLIIYRWRVKLGGFEDK